MTELTAEPIAEDVYRAYVSSRWPSNRFEWAIGLSRPYCKAIYGDAIPDKSLDPIFVFAQKPGGLSRVYGFYGQEFIEPLSEAARSDGFEVTQAGKLTVQDRSYSKGQTKERAAVASVASFTLRPIQAPYWRPEEHKETFIGPEACEVGAGYVEFNIAPDQVRYTSHGQQIVRKPMPQQDLPKNLEELCKYAESINLTVLHHPVGVIIKE